VAYLRETQRGSILHLAAPRRRDLAQHVVLDEVTLRSLEVERSLRRDSREGTLLAAIDNTSSAMGARLLRRWLCYPLRSVAEIGRRQARIRVLRESPRVRKELRSLLREVGDLGRMVGRIGVQRATPRDLRALGDGLSQLAPIRAQCSALGPSEIDAFNEALEGLDPVATELTRTLRADAPLIQREGGIFQSGYHAELDRLHEIATRGEAWLAEYQAREIKRTGIPTLKVAFNKVFGYYIEVTNPHRDRVPTDYVRRQTVKNAERYVTDELERYESEALSADTRSRELEAELFLALRQNMVQYIPAIQRAADALAELDVCAANAELASQLDFCAPEFVDADILEIDAGRHPVVELQSGSQFVPNDTRLGEKTLALITGPNMAGKSTYIRQVAVLTLLAHCGLCVPARGMRLGVVDRIFTRVGASDELARGQSTFMVEMLETANILHNATDRSLVILDEIGRGTSTFDGLALAWAITEHLASAVHCRTLFATHYHELTELADLVDGVFNLCVRVREFEDQVVFLHQIGAGAADRSYGLHVGKLAGLPRGVLDRAHAVLNELEKTFARESQRPVLAAAQRRRTRQLRLFELPEEQVVRELRSANVDSLTPEAAIAMLAQWRALLGTEPGKAL
jgi:DNA mismatch repair protein MutS